MCLGESDALSKAPHTQTYTPPPPPILPLFSYFVQKFLTHTPHTSFHSKFSSHSTFLNHVTPLKANYPSILSPVSPQFS